MTGERLADGSAAPVWQYAGAWIDSPYGNANWIGVGDPPGHHYMYYRIQFDLADSQQRGRATHRARLLHLGVTTSSHANNQAAGHARGLASATTLVHKRSYPAPVVDAGYSGTSGTLLPGAPARSSTATGTSTTPAIRS